MTCHPRDAGFCQPGEWAPHSACWVGWPSDPELWPDLPGTQAAFVALCRGIAGPAWHVPGECLQVLVQTTSALHEAQAALTGLDARFHVVPFGDLWLRDTGPVFLVGRQGAVATLRFPFNGWGGKYTYPGDAELAGRVQTLCGIPAFTSPLVCEGGAIESDGGGLCLTTRAVLLNVNRNPGLSQGDAEDALRDAVGAERVIWLDSGLLNDHTDGHIDNIARFVGPARVACMRADDADDPNREVLASIHDALAREALDVVTLPSPGLVTSRDGHALPASYLNFYIANHSVVVPTFGSRYDAAALRAIERLFPGRAVVGVDARLFLEEGGTLHCITQQQPAGGGSP